MSNSLIQRSFAAGEVSPALLARDDQTKVQTGLAVCRNFIVRRHGGIANRPGLKYITAQRDSSAQGRLWKFVFNAEQTYLLLFEHQTLRFIKLGALLTVSGVVAYSGATAYVPGNLASSAGVNYYCLANTTGNAPPNATYWYAMPGGNIYEIPTPYTAAHLSTLRFSQSGDVITITRHGYDVRELSRSGDTSWVLATITTVPSISAPGSLTVSGAAGTVAVWVATAIKSVTLEESVASPTAGASTVPTSAATRTLTIGAVAGAQEYNIYRSDGNGIYGFVGSAGSTTFIDTGILPDYNLTPPISTSPFSGANDKPAVSGYYGQRRVYGNTVTDPENIFGSRVGSFKNHTISSPSQDDDAVEFTLAGRQVNEIRAIVEIGELVILTSGAEWIREGGATDPMTPSSPNLKVQTYNGSADLEPIVIGDNLLYVQARGSVVRDFRFDQAVGGYTGRDLSVFSHHLFAGYTIARWDYAQIPDSIAYAARSDGTLLGLTYLREHEIWGWHRHDTDGAFEDVCVIPEGQEDVSYLLVNRTINGATVRSVEQQASRHVSDIAVDATFMDAYLTYDGRHTGATTMTLTTETVWVVDTDLTLTASAATFTAGDIGNAIVLSIVTKTYTPENGAVSTTETLTCTIAGYTSTTVVTVNASKDVPVSFQGVAITVWGRAVDQVAGLGHLEGKTVSILADGHVITNGIDAPLITISGGQLSTAFEHPYVIIHVGLPYCSDAQLLDREVLGGETLRDKQKSVNQVTVLVESSRGVWAGEPNANGQISADDLYEHPQRDVGDEYGMIEGVTGKIDVSIRSSWNTGGRVHFRQRDPLPLTILAVIPNVELGG
mgnify:CR=1 FL=1